MLEDLQDKISRQSWCHWSDLFELLVEKEWLTVAKGPIFWCSQFESQLLKRPFLTFWLPESYYRYESYSSYFLNHLSVSSFSSVTHGTPYLDGELHEWNVVPSYPRERGSSVMTGHCGRQTGSPLSSSSDHRLHPGGTRYPPLSKTTWRSQSIFTFRINSSCAPSHPDLRCSHIMLVMVQAWSRTVQVARPVTLTNFDRDFT